MKITKRQLRRIVETATGRKAARASMYRTQRKNMGYDVDEEDRLQDMYSDIDDYFDGGYDEEEREWIVYDETEGRFVPSGVSQKGPIGKIKAYHNVNGTDARKFKAGQMAAAMMENKMKITKRQLRRIIRESLDSMYGSDNLEPWKGAYSGRPYPDDPEPVENISQVAYDAGLAGKRMPQEIEDIQYSHPEDYVQAEEAYADGLADKQAGI